MFRKAPAAEETMSTFNDPGFDGPKFQQSQPRFGDAGPLGLSAFAFTTFLMALINLSAGGVTVPNIIIGPAMIYGGLGQLLAGMW